jgi:hypothetical protein
MPPARAGFQAGPGQILEKTSWIRAVYSSIEAARAAALMFAYISRAAETRRFPVLVVEPIADIRRKSISEAVDQKATIRTRSFVVITKPPN